MEEVRRRGSVCLTETDVGTEELRGGDTDLDEEVASVSFGNTTCALHRLLVQQQKKTPGALLTG